MGFFLSVIAIIFALAAIMFVVRLSTPTARRKRFDIPDLTALADNRQPFPMWTTVTTTVEVPMVVGQAAPTPPQAVTTTTAEMAEVHNQISALVREMNQHLNAARFDEALRVAEQVTQLASTLPPDLRNSTRFTVDMGTLNSASAPKPAADKTVKTRFDLIG